MPSGYKMDKFKLIESKDNFMLKRKEVKGVIEAEKTPSFEEAKEEISKDFKIDKEFIAIKKIDGGYGSKKFSVNAFIYSSKEDKENTEKKPKIKTVPGQAPAPAK